MKKLLAILLACTVLLSATACNDGSKKDDPVVTGNVKVCTMTNLERAMKNRQFTGGGSKLVIKAFQNEYEGAQIIMTPDYNVRSYTLTLSDLTCGENKLSKNNFELFNEKYIKINRDIEGGRVWYNNALAPQKNGDMQPDALLPMSAAIEYGENVIEKGNNQGIYVSVKIPKGQPAGVYTGNFELDVDGNKTNVPVEVTVWGYELSDETHSRSMMAVMFDCNKYGEANLTEYMEKLYVENLLNFRLSPQQLPTLIGDGRSFKKSQIAHWLDSVVEYAQDPRCSLIDIPLPPVNNVEDNGITYTVSPNMDVYEAIMVETAKRSLKEGINLFEKMDLWLNIFDESEQNGNVNNQEHGVRLIKALQENLATEWKAQVAAGTWFAEEGYTYDTDFAYEVIETMRTIKQFVTDSSTGNMRWDSGQWYAGMKFQPGDPDYDKDLPYQLKDAYYEIPCTYKVRAGEFDNPYTRDFLDKYLDWYNEYYNTDDAETWMYMAVYPQYPYCDYLLDSDLLMQRTIGWEMQQYNIAGIESWYTNMYRNMPGYNKGFQVITDPYETATRFPESNGDGFITYPGMPYGIQGPINTLRLYSVRDGLEDYEVLYLLKEEYKKVVEKAGLTFDHHTYEKMVEYMTQSFFQDARVKGDKDDMNDRFFAAREAMVSLLDMVTKTETVIYDYEKFEGSATLTLLSTNASSVTLDGDNVAVQDFAGYKMYTVNFDTRDDVSYTMSVNTSSETVDVTVGTGYKHEILNAETLKDIFSATVEDAGATIEDNVYRYTLAAGADRSFEFDLTAYDLSNYSEEIWFNVYNYGSEDVVCGLRAWSPESVSWRVFDNGYGIHRDEQFTVTLKPGENIIKVPTYLVLRIHKGQRTNGRYSSISKMRFVPNGNDQLSLGFKQITFER